MRTINMNQQPSLSFESLWREAGHDSEVIIKVAHETLRIRFQRRLYGRDERFELKVTKKGGAFYFVDVKPDSTLTKIDLLRLEELALIQTSYRLARHANKWLA